MGHAKSGSRSTSTGIYSPARRTRRLDCSTASWRDSSATAPPRDLLHGYHVAYRVDAAPGAGRAHVVLAEWRHGMRQLGIVLVVAVAALAWTSTASAEHVTLPPAAVDACEAA